MFGRSNGFIHRGAHTHVLVLRHETHLYADTGKPTYKCHKRHLPSWRPVEFLDEFSAKVPFSYCALVGSNDESWGWDLGRNLLIHNDQNVVPLCYTEEMFQNSNGNTPYPQQHQSQVKVEPNAENKTCSKNGVAKEPFVVPDKFLMALDMDAGRLGFMSNGVWLGWAFGDFRGKELVNTRFRVVGKNDIYMYNHFFMLTFRVYLWKELFPAVSCVWGHCEVTLKYLNYSYSPLSLQVNLF